MKPKIGYLVRELSINARFEFYGEEGFNLDLHKWEYEIKRIVYFELEEE
jgi:hypothetical protein